MDKRRVVLRGRERQRLTGVPGLGDVTIRATTLGDAIEAEKLRDAAPASDNTDVYVNYLLARAIVVPDQSVEQVAAYSAATINRLVPAVARTMGLRDYYAKEPKALGPRARLDAAHRRRWDDLGQSVSLDMRKALAGMSTTLAMMAGPAGAAAQLQRTLEMIRATVPPPAQIQRITDLVRSFVPPPDQIRRITEMFQAMAPPPDQLQRTMELIRGLATPMPLMAFNRIPVDVLGSFPQTVQAISSIKLPEGVLDSALLAARVNSPLIHTPTYQPAPTRRRPTLPLSKEEAERRRLVDAFDVLSKLESSLRRTISDGLANRFGDDWWRLSVPEAVRSACELKKRDKEKDGEPGHSPLTYGYIDDYRAIIIRRDNWNEVFQSVFENRTFVEACFMWCGPPRQDIAHVRPLSDRRYNEFVWGARWLLAAIERALPETPAD